MKRIKNLKRIVHPNKNEISVYYVKYGKKHLNITFDHKTHHTEIFHNGKSIVYEVWNRKYSWESWLEHILEAK